MQDGDPQLGIVVQTRVGLAQFAVHARREAVVLRGPVDADQEHVAANLAGDAAFGRSFGSVGHEKCRLAMRIHGRRSEPLSIASRLTATTSLSTCAMLPAIIVSASA